MLAAPRRFEERRAAVPSSSSQHEVLRRPGAVVLHPRTHPFSGVDALNTWSRDVVLLEVVGFELTQEHRTFVALVLVPV